MSRPYFQTKVVKIGKPKPKREMHINSRGAGKSSKYWGSFSNKVLERLQINAKRELKRRKTIEPKLKGNWVNNENLDKIKFPCFCSWNIPLDKDRYHGILVQGEGNIYNLYSLRGQHSYSRLVGTNKNLKELIKRWNIHILKGKIIIYEENIDKKYDIDIEE